MLFPANIERNFLKKSMHLYCGVISLCKFGALFVPGIVASTIKVNAKIVNIQLYSTIASLLL